MEDILVGYVKYVMGVEFVSVGVDKICCYEYILLFFCLIDLSIYFSVVFVIDVEKLCESMISRIMKIGRV